MSNLALLVLAGAGTMGIAVLGVIRHWRSRRALVERTAARVGLGTLAGPQLSARQTETRARGFRVSATWEFGWHTELGATVDTTGFGWLQMGRPLRLDPSTRKTLGVSLSVDGEGRIPRELTVAREGVGAKVLALIGGSDISIGDAPFDDEILLRGPEPICRALMTGPVRKRLRSLVPLVGIEVRNGVVTAKAGDVTADGGRRIEALLATVLELAESLVLTTEALPARLADVAGYDPIPAVRARCLGLLLSRFGGTEEAKKARLLGLEDPDAGVALVSAQADPLVAVDPLVEIAGSDSAAPEHRARALKVLARNAPRETAVPALVSGMLASAKEVRQTAIEWLGRLSVNDAAPEILHVLNDTTYTDPTTAAVAADALGRLRFAGAENTLIERLAHRSPDVKAAAARALSRMGTARALPALSALDSALVPSPVRSAARLAARAIHRRAGNPEPGRLSIAEVAATEGALSVADERQGALAVSDSAHEG